MKKKKHVILMIVITVFIAGGSFFGGMKYQEQKSPRGMRAFGANNGVGNGQGANTGSNQLRRNGARQVMGEIIGKDDTSITVKLPDGSSKIILISGTTTINKATEGLKSDLTIGDRVAVFGTDNTDGSVTGQTIQLNPK